MECQSVGFDATIVTAAVNIVIAIDICTYQWFVTPIDFYYSYFGFSSGCKLF